MNLQRVRRPALLCAILLVPSMASCTEDPMFPAWVTDPAQLLQNGDVELGATSPDNWNRSTGSMSPYALLYIERREAASGLRKLQIRTTATPPDGAFAYWFQRRGIEDPTGLTFILTAAVKLDAMTGTAAIAIRGEDTSLDNTGPEAFATTQGSQLLTGSADWRRISVGLSNVPSNVDELTVFLIHSGGVGTVDFDDISLSVKRTVMQGPR